MPKRVLTVVFGMQTLFTPNGVQTIPQGFSGELDDDEHYVKVMEAWQSNPKGIVKVHISPEELKESKGVLDANTYLDLNRALWISVREETNIDISSGQGIVDINDKRRFH